MDSKQTMSIYKILLNLLVIAFTTASSQVALHDIQVKPCQSSGFLLTMNHQYTIVYQIIDQSMHFQIKSHHTSQQSCRLSISSTYSLHMSDDKLKILSTDSTECTFELSETTKSLDINGFQGCILLSNEEQWICQSNYNNECQNVKSNGPRLLKRATLCDAGTCKNGGLCLVANNNEHCVCGETSYSGLHCENPVNHCVTTQINLNITTLPVCLNNATCTPNYKIQPFFNCTCLPGFTGTRCEINIDECADNPCANGNCTDEINDYSCKCQPGWEGKNCSINIDECEPKPCLNGGQCIDKINAYECNCTDTGFTSANCSINIDDCADKPCQNNATCTDLIKDYNCTCHQGYSDKNCATDINECQPTNPCSFNSTCLQWSMPSYYSNTLYNTIYPFNGTFSYNQASGFSCKCVEGAFGQTCQINPNDCLVPNTNTSKCIHSTSCTDKLNDYDCHCIAGYEGKNCSTEINECNLYKPCQNSGACIDKINDYHCNCSETYGGKNCSVTLTGCQGVTCSNAGTCDPVLIQETPTIQHDFKCKCSPEWSGKLCNVSSLFHFNGSSVLAFKNTEMTYLKFDLKTTLENTKILRVNNSDRFLEISIQKSFLMVDHTGNSSIELLNIQNQLTLSFWFTVSIFSDGKVYINNSLISQLNNFPENVYSNTSDVTIAHDPNNLLPFKGCLRNIQLSNNVVINVESIFTRSTHVTMGSCIKTANCPSTCVLANSKKCQDFWDSKKCICKTNYAGDNCQSQLPNTIFGQNNNISLLEFNVSNFNPIYNGEKKLEITFLVQTRLANSFVFFLGTTETSSYMASKIDADGKLLLLLSNGSTVVSITSNSIVTTGESIEISLTYEFSGTLRLTTSTVSKSLNVKMLATTLNFVDFQIIFGSFKEAKQPIFVLPRTKRSISLSGSSFSNLYAFKGVLNGAKINEDPLVSSPISGIPSAKVASTATDVSSGTNTDDICGEISGICKNGATCANKYLNDYTCTCVKGWTGKNCSEVDHCATSSTCPSNSKCQVVPESGFECQTVATLSYNTQTLDNTITVKSNIKSDVTINNLVVKFKTRLSNAHLISIGSPIKFEIAIKSNKLVTTINSIDFISFDNVTSTKEATDWLTVTLSMTNSAIVQATLSFKNGTTLTQTSSQVLSTAPSIPTNTDIVLAKQFKGCLGEIKINTKWLLPLVNYDLKTTEGFKVSTMVAKDVKYAIDGCSGDTVCQSGTCLNDGTCQDLWNVNQCQCKKGYSGEKCEKADCNVVACVGTAGVHPAVIVVLCVVGLGVLIALLAFLIVRAIRRKRTETGLYKPSSEEGRQHHLTTMNGVKLPPTERLI